MQTGTGAGQNESAIYVKEVKRRHAVLFCSLDLFTFSVLLWDHVPERESETGEIKKYFLLDSKSISCLIQKVFLA